MKLIIVLLALLVCAVPAHAQSCLDCDGTHCFFVPLIGNTGCHENLGRCELTGGLCIDIQWVLDFTPIRGIPVRIAQASPEQLDRINAECDRTPGCRWYTGDGRSGGYRSPWGQLAVLYR